MDKKLKDKDKLKEAVKHINIWIRECLRVNNLAILAEQLDFFFYINDEKIGSDLEIKDDSLIYLIDDITVLDCVWKCYVLDFSLRKNLAVQRILTIVLKILNENLNSYSLLIAINDLVKLTDKEEIGRIKRYYLKEIADKNNFMSCYVNQIIEQTGIFDQEILIRLSAMGYEKRNACTRLYFLNSDDKYDKEKAMLLEKAITVNLKKLRQLRKLMELSGDNCGLLIRKPNYEIEGVIVNEEINNCFYIDIKGYLVWEVHYKETTVNDMLLCYKNGTYELPAEFNEREDLLKKSLEKLKIPEKQQKKIYEIVENLKSVANHGTGIVFAEDTILEKEIERLKKYNKLYKIKDFNLLEHNEMLPGISAIDGAIFCDFNCNCKAIGVIVDGKSCIVGDSSRGARYNSLNNYSKCIDIESDYKGKKYIIIIISEDETMDIKISKME